MRSPEGDFDLRASLVQELEAVLEELKSNTCGPKALHHCRVRLKRARTLGNLGKAVAPGLAAVFDDTAAALMRQLEHARDLSALAEIARATAKQRSKCAPALMAVADALQSTLDRLPEINSESARAGVRDLIALAQVWPQPSARQIRGRAHRIVKRARRARRRASGTRDATLRHDWRKREQSRLFAATILGEAWPEPRRRKRAHALTDALGLERDAVLLMARLEQDPELAGGVDAAKRAIRALRKRSGKLRRRADRLAARLQAGGA